MRTISLRAAPSPRRRALPCGLVAAFALVHAASLCGQGVPYLVRDVNSQSSSPTALHAPFEATAVTVGSTTFFAGAAAEGGFELWKSDGTPGGTALVCDIEPGSESSYPQGFAEIGGIVYFAAEEKEFGKELWRSDGTPSGTYRVRDIDVGEEGSNPAHLTVVGGLLYFSAHHPTYGRELWQSDGTRGGTVLVADVRPGTASSMSQDSEIIAGVRVGPVFTATAVLWAANDGVHGNEVWDSSVFGTRLRDDVNPGAGSSDPSGFCSSGGYVMLGATDGSSGREPYVTRTSAITRARDVNAGAASSNPEDFAVGSFGGTVKFYFSAVTSTAGAELWEYDTATSAAAMVVDLYAGLRGSNPIPFVGRTTILFSAETPTYGRELWRTDGTSRGTVLVKDIHTSGNSDPTEFFALSTSPLRVLFAADDGVRGKELWFTDGTTAGTRLVEDLNPAGPSEPKLLCALANGRALLSAQPDANVSGYYSSDGTSAGTDFLLPSAPGAESSDPHDFTGSSPGAKAWFGADDGVSGGEPWISDGSAASTQRLRDIRAGSTNSLPFSFFASADLDGRTIFPASDASSGLEPWVSDGTPAGTVRLADIYPGSTASNPVGFIAMDGFVLFFATDPTHGTELWRTDGTSAGTRLVVDIEPGTASSASTSINTLGRHGGLLYFFGNVPAYGSEPWVSDGTAQGTRLLKDIMPGSGSGAGGNGALFLSTPSYAFFIADDGSSGRELWRSAGSTATTQRVVDLAPGAGETLVYDMVWALGQVFFLATTPTTQGLFSTNASGSSAALVRAFPLSSSYRPMAAQLTSLGSKVVFGGYSAGAGWEPWVSDGTGGGTAVLRDIRPSTDSSLPLSMPIPLAVFFTGWFYAPQGARTALFAAGTSSAGIELWRTDGTTAGTVLHADIVPGPLSSSPTEPAFANDRLYFSAFEPITGREPYAMTPMAMTAIFRAGCVGTNSLVPELRALDSPFLGNASFELLLDRARPASAGGVNLGFAAWNIPIGGGCALLIDQVLPYASFPVQTTIRGDAILGLPLPGDPLLQGLGVFAQGFVVDPAGAFANTLSFTGGWRAILHSQ